MRKVRLNELNEAVRSFFAQALSGDGFVLEDETGQARGGFMPYRRPTDKQRQQAFADLQRLWQHTDQAMHETGVTEEDIDRVLQQDD